MPTNGSPPKTPNMAPLGGLFGSKQYPDDNVEASDDYAGDTPSKDTQFRQPTNQLPLPPGYSHPPSQSPLPGAPQVYHPAPFNIKPISQPSSGGAKKGYLSYGPSWKGYDFPQGGSGGQQMFPHQQFPRQGPSSPDACRVPPALTGTIPVNLPQSPAPIHSDKFQAHLGELPLASTQNDFNRLQNCTGQMLQGLWR